MVARLADGANHVEQQQGDLAIDGAVGEGPTHPGALRLHSLHVSVELRAIGLAVAYGVAMLAAWNIDPALPSLNPSFGRLELHPLAVDLLVVCIHRHTDTCLDIPISR